MFENNKVYIPAIREEVHLSRIIASWLNTGNDIYDATVDKDGEPEYSFMVWLAELGIDEQTAHKIREIMTCGKLELEITARRFRNSHEVLK